MRHRDNKKVNSLTAVCPRRSQYDKETLELQKAPNLAVSYLLLSFFMLFFRRESLLTDFNKRPATAVNLIIVSVIMLIWSYIPEFVRQVFANAPDPAADRSLRAIKSLMHFYRIVALPLNTYLYVDSSTPPNELLGYCFGLIIMWGLRAPTDKKLVTEEENQRDDKNYQNIAINLMSPENKALGILVAGDLLGLKFYAEENQAWALQMLYDHLKRSYYPTITLFAGELRLPYTRFSSNPSANTIVQILGWNDFARKMLELYRAQSELGSKIINYDPDTQSLSLANGQILPVNNFQKQIRELRMRRNSSSPAIFLAPAVLTKPAAKIASSHPTDHGAQTSDPLSKKMRAPSSPKLQPEQAQILDFGEYGLYDPKDEDLTDPERIRRLEWQFNERICHVYVVANQKTAPALQQIWQNLAISNKIGALNRLTVYWQPKRVVNGLPEYGQISLHQDTHAFSTDAWCLKLPPGHPPSFFLVLNTSAKAADLSQCPGVRKPNWPEWRVDYAEKTCGARPKLG